MSFLNQQQHPQSYRGNAQGGNADILKEVRKAVEEAVAAEVILCNKERNASPMAKDSVQSNPISLLTEDTTFTLPDFFPLGSTEWPEPLLELFGKTQCHFQLGFFPEISRVWCSIDNRLVLWDYRDGRDYCVYEDVNEIIVCVGRPTRPKPGVFESHITYILPFATPNTLNLVGIWVGDELNTKNLRILTLDYTLVVDMPVTKIVCIREQGRVFCMSDNTNVYELHYNSENTPLIPKMRVASYAYWCSHVPVVSQLFSVGDALRQTWTKRRLPIRDIAVDEHRSILFSLDIESNITSWKITPRGMKRSSSISYKSLGIVDSADPLHPLVKLMVIRTDSEGCSLVAFARNGDQFRYRCNAYMNSTQIELYFGLRIKSYVPSDQVISSAFASDSCVMYAYSDKNDDGASDQLLVATTPKCILSPHNTSRDIVANFVPVSPGSNRTSQGLNDPNNGSSAAGGSIARVSAIEKIVENAHMSPNDLCSQVTVAPTCYLVAHQRGLSISFQARPIDTLYLILSCSDGKTRENLIRRFSEVYNPTDYVAMLLQIALDRVHPHNTADAGRGGRDGGHTIPESLHEDSFAFAQASPGVPTLEHLGQTIFDKTTNAARDLAAQLLQNATVPGIEANYLVGNDSRQITITLSPYTNAVVAYLARTLYPLWEAQIADMGRASMLCIMNNLEKLVLFLERRNVNMESGSNLYVPSVPQQWSKEKVVLTLPNHTDISKQDVMRFDMSALFQGYLIAQKALETCIFFQYCGGFPFQSSDLALSFGQVVRDNEVSRRLGSTFIRAVAVNRQSISSNADILAKLPKKCPNFCNIADIQSYIDRMEVDALTRDQRLSSLSEAGLLQWFDNALPYAAAYWDSGALKKLCVELKTIKREELAVHLLLHAAQQIDSGNVSLPIYLSESTGVSVQRNANPSQYALYLKKKAILEEVVSLIESSWFSHRSAIDRMLGSAYNSGTIWGMEPNDEMAHTYLFDWYTLPRQDPSITKNIRATLVRANSRFLKSFMERKATALPEEYAQFVRINSGDAHAAIDLFVSLAESELSHIPSEERLKCRMANMREAVACAESCKSHQKGEIKRRLQNLEAQDNLRTVINKFLSSNSPSLDVMCNFNGVRCTQRETATQHYHALSSFVIPHTELFEIAGLYVLFGGGEVQMSLIAANGSYSTNLLYRSVENCYRDGTRTKREISKLLVQKYASNMSAFPLVYVVSVLEEEEYQRSPTGSKHVVDFLQSCGVDCLSLFRAYVIILERNTDEPILVERLRSASFSAGYLVYSLAYTMHRLDEVNGSSQMRQTHMYNHTMTKVREYIRNAGANSTSSEESHAIRCADAFLRDTDNRRLMNAY